VGAQDAPEPEGAAVAMGTHEVTSGASTSSVQVLAEEALRELVEVASQVEATAIVERDAGTGSAPLAAIFGATVVTGARATKLGDVAHRLLDQAEASRTELGREPVVQCEVATGTGHVFVVASGDHAIVAVTTAEPTVGLVFYDLKTALRALRDATTHVSPERHSSNGSGTIASSASASTAGDDEGDDDEATTADDTTNDGGE
jgi:predicted regulator of Ras-like GTPase activity (Roadblock/LC7/MglB family)